MSCRVVYFSSFRHAGPKMAGERQGRRGRTIPRPEDSWEHEKTITMISSKNCTSDDDILRKWISLLIMSSIINIERPGAHRRSRVTALIGLSSVTNPRLQHPARPSRGLHKGPACHVDPDSTRKSLVLGPVSVKALRRGWPPSFLKLGAGDAPLLGNSCTR